MTELSYFLAVDVGTSRIAAATARIAADGSIVTAPFALGRKSDSVATVVFVAEDGDLSFGDVAERRGVAQPERLIREFKRSIGDEVPLVVGGRSLPAEQLYALTIAAIVELVTEREGQRPEAVSLTHPTAWGGHRLEMIRSALHRVGVGDIELITEPEAAARHYEATRSFEPGQTLAVYDLGGGTFDTVILRKEIDGSFGLVGEPVGIDNLGGADFDDAVLRHAIQASNLDVTSLAVDDPDTRLALSQLRRECVDAKEALSFDTEATIPVLVPPVHTTVRLTRSEFEEMIAASLDQTVDALDDSLESAGLEAERLESILLIGGSSRIPSVAQRLSERFDRPIAIDADPKAAIALGAARTVLVRLHDRYLAAPSTAVALLNASEGAAALALVEGDRAAAADGAPTFVSPVEKARKSSPFVLGGAAVVIAGAIVFASTLSAGMSSDGRLTSATATPTPSAIAGEPIVTDAPLAETPAEAAAPPAKAEDSPGSSPAPANPRRSATPVAPKTTTTTTTVKPTTPPPSSTAQSPTQGGSGGTTTPTGPTTTTPTTPSPSPTTDPTPDSTPTPTPTPTTDPTPTPDPTTPAPDPTTPAPDPTTPAPEPEPTTEPTPDPPAPEPTTEPPAPEPTEAPPVEETPAPQPEPTASETPAV